jgi:TPR repeat protein
MNKLAVAVVSALTRAKTQLIALLLVAMSPLVAVGLATPGGAASTQRDMPIIASEPGWLGISIRDSVLIGHDPDYVVPAGAVDVDEFPFADTPASRAGIRVNDTIISINDAEIASGADLVQRISALRPGTIAKLQVIRDNKFVYVDVAVGGKVADFWRAAQIGDASAMRQIADWYSEGGILQKDFSRAASWYFAAADAGDPYSAFICAGMYLRGMYVQQNIAKGIDLLEKAASAGNIEAMFQRGFLAEQGALGAAKIDDAISWYKKAADQNHPAAHLKLAEAYYHGRVGAPDFQKTIHHLYAASSKLPDTAVNIARMYSTGQGVTKNNHAAAKWLFKGIREGSEQALQSLAGSPNTWPKDVRRFVQQYMKDAKLYDGAADGQMGARTLSALQQLAARGTSIQ